METFSSWTILNAIFDVLQILFFQGWFYHAPEKKRINVDRVEYPAPSQIPGIGYDDPTLLEKEEVQEMMFKETDSKYIRMAKLGGRKGIYQDLSFEMKYFTPILDV